MKYSQQIQETDTPLPYNPQTAFWFCCLFQAANVILIAKGSSPESSSALHYYASLVSFNLDFLNFPIIFMDLTF